MNFPRTRALPWRNMSPHHTTVLIYGKPVHGWILRNVMMIAKCLEWGLLTIYWENYIRFSVTRQSDGGPTGSTHNTTIRDFRAKRAQVLCISSLNDMSHSHLTPICSHLASLGDSPTRFGIAPATEFRSSMQEKISHASTVMRPVPF